MDPTGCYYVFEYLDWRELKILKGVSGMFNRVAYRVQASRDKRSESNAVGLFNRCYLCDEIASDPDAFTKCIEEHCTFMYHNKCGDVSSKNNRNNNREQFNAWFNGLGGVPVLPFNINQIHNPPSPPISILSKEFKIYCKNCYKWRCDMCHQSHIYELCPQDDERYCQNCIDDICDCMMCGKCNCNGYISKTSYMCETCRDLTGIEYE